jgi:amidase
MCSRGGQQESDSALRDNEQADAGSTVMFTRIAVTIVLLSPFMAMADQSPDSRARHEEATVAQLQAEMASGRLTSEQLTREYIARILAFDQDGPGVNAVMELNPDAIAMARHADE